MHRLVALEGLQDGLQKRRFLCFVLVLLLGGQRGLARELGGGDFPKEAMQGDHFVVSLSRLVPREELRAEGDPGTAVQLVPHRSHGLHQGIPDHARPLHREIRGGRLRNFFFPRCEPQFVLVGEAPRPPRFGAGLGSAPPRGRGLLGREVHQGERAVSQASAQVGRPNHMVLVVHGADETPLAAAERADPRGSIPRFKSSADGVKVGDRKRGGVHTQVEPLLQRAQQPHSTTAQGLHEVIALRSSDHGGAGNRLPNDLDVHVENIHDHSKQNQTQGQEGSDGPDVAILRGQQTVPLLGGLRVRVAASAGLIQCGIRHVGAPGRLSIDGAHHAEGASQASEAKEAAGGTVEGIAEGVGHEDRRVLDRLHDVIGQVLHCLLAQALSAQLALEVLAHLDAGRGCRGHTGVSLVKVSLCVGRVHHLLAWLAKDEGGGRRRHQRQ
mmetsp:Transcript_6990/g.26908  ORF Transcript_6990/g.26908 Transcript_6990/m.26908 type:complete len:440 (+) Transcript_6990:969-2288(+)